MRENITLPRAHFGPIPLAHARDEVLMSHGIRWMREHGTLHIPDVRAQSQFPQWVTIGGLRTHLGRSPSSARTNSLADCTRVAPRCVRLPRRRSNCSKPSPTRRSSPSRTCGCFKNSRNRWSSKRRRVKSWACHCQLANGHSAGVGYGRGECGAGMRRNRCTIRHARRQHAASAVAPLDRFRCLRSQVRLTGSTELGGRTSRYRSQTHPHS